jgi:hypothetical protein
MKTRRNRGKTGKEEDVFLLGGIPEMLVKKIPPPLWLNRATYPLVTPKGHRCQRGRADVEKRWVCLR